MNETDAFDDFDDELKLDPAERLRAEKCHNEITLLLIGADLIVKAFLQGSFARKTMISPLRDVDKVVILGDKLRGLTPDQVMDRLQEVLAAAYPAVTFDRTRHSLKLDFGDDSFCFDVVPAWETNTDDDDVLIANRDSGGWDRSNTRQLMRVVAERNKQTDGGFVHAVRMIKHLVAHQMDEIIPGLHVESLAYLGLTSPMTYANACVTIIESAATWLAHGYNDPTGVDPISNRLTPEQRASAQAQFVAAAARATEAHKLAEAGDHDNATRVWHDIFGETFPEPESQLLGAALASAAGGSVTSTGHTSATTRGRQPAPPTRSWRHCDE
jgi:hypothetical protein